MVPSSTNRTIDEKMDWLHPDHRESAGVPTELKDQISWFPNRVFTNIKNDICWYPSRVESLNQLVSQPSRQEENKKWAEQFQPIVKLWAEQFQPITK